MDEEHMTQANPRNAEGEEDCRKIDFDEGNRLTQHGTYCLMTGWYGGGPILRRGRMFTDIIPDSEGMKIDMIPRKKNKCPYIRYSDISAVQDKTVIGTYWIFFMGWCVAFALMGMFPALLGVPLCVWLGRMVKVSIRLQDGTVAEIRGRKDAKGFADDLRGFMETQRNTRR